MSIKLVAFDLDGTMLDSKKQVSPRNMEAMKACVERGIYVVPATGRTIIGIPEEIKSLPGVRYAITLNGAIVWDMEKSMIVSEERLEKDVTMEILDLVSQYHVMYDIYINGVGISEARFFYHLDEYNLSEEMQKLVRLTRTVVPDIKEYVKESPVLPEKINLYFDNMEMREEIRGLVNARGDVIVSSSMWNNLEINTLSATKGEGLAHLAAYLGLGMDETMACGDGENDFNMIQMAGMGVAMDNGEEQLKQLADYVTASNDEDGVALAIEKFALCK